MERTGAIMSVFTCIRTVVGLAFLDIDDSIIHCIHLGKKDA